MIWNWGHKACAVILGLSLVSVGQAQSHVEVRSPSARLIETEPGRIVTTTVVVANRGGERDEIVERLLLPEGFVRVSPPDLPFPVEGYSQSVRVLAIQVPASMRAGRYDLRYVAQSRRDPSSSAGTDLSIVVVGRDDFSLTVEQRPDTVIAGDNYAVKLRAVNLGNRPVGVDLSSRSSLELKFHVSPSSFRLDPGASCEVHCQVETANSLTRRASHAMIFDAAIRSPGGQASASVTALTEIVPITSGVRDVYHRYPMRLKTMALFESGREAEFQAELSGEGTLDEAGRRSVDFVFRGPDIQNSSVFGEHDEYGISYHDETWDVSVGDRVFSLSPLTEQSAFGRGAGFTWHDGATSVGAFYMSTRFRRENSEEVGAFIRREGKGVTWQTSVLRKWGGAEVSKGSVPQNILSIEGRYGRKKEFDLRLEAAVSRADSGEMDYAWRADVRGELFDRVSYSVEHVHAGPNFNGYYSDTETTYASFSAPLTQRLKLHGSLSRYAGNLAIDDQRSSVVNREYSWQTGLNYEAVKKTNLSLQWQHVRRDDILNPAAYDFTEDAVRFGAGRSWKQLQFQSFVDFGTLDNRITGESGGFRRYSGFLAWQPGPRLSGSVFASYGPSAFTGSRDQELNVGASATWRVSDTFTATASYARNQYDSLRGRESDQAMASVRYQFQNKSEISLVGRWNSAASSQTGPETAIMVSITRPFDVAVSRKTSIGSLHGRLVEWNSGNPVVRAIITAGGVTAVTDADGAFEFPSLKPGMHEVRVVADSLGPAMVMATALPLKVKVRSADTTRVNLQAVKAASMVVKLMVAGAKPGGAKLEGCVVELSNGRDAVRSQTDRIGVAEFERMTPGPWKLRILNDNIPPRHTVENPNRNVVLVAGERVEIEVRLQPSRRTFKIIDQGAIPRH